MQGGGGSVVLPTCDGGVCVPDAPPNWEPVCMLTDTNAAACAGAWGTELGDGGIGAVLAAADLQCPATCTCQVMSPSCEVPFVAHYSDSACVNNGTPVMIQSGCNPYPGSGIKLLPIFPTGNCVADPVQTAPQAAFADKARICAAPRDGSSDGCRAGSRCLSDPGACTPCIMQPGGDKICPTVDFTARTVLAVDYVDERACACTCGEATGGSCSATAKVCPSADTTCTCNALHTFDNNCIVEASANIELQILPQVTGQPNCPATPVTQGSVNVIESWTVCCLE
jgi:hypothetical protein